MDLVHWQRVSITMAKTCTEFVYPRSNISNRAISTIISFQFCCYVWCLVRILSHFLSATLFLACSIIARINSKNIVISNNIICHIKYRRKSGSAMLILCKSTYWSLFLNMHDSDSWLDDDSNNVFFLCEHQLHRHLTLNRAIISLALSQSVSVNERDTNETERNRCSVATNWPKAKQASIIMMTVRRASIQEEASSKKQKLDCLTNWNWMRNDDENIERCTFDEPIEKMK